MNESAILQNSALRSTEIRRQVLQVFLRANAALSQREIEDSFSDIDRVTLYRTLRTFEDKGIIHQAFDGTDVAKYALCSDHCSEHHHHDDHLHFHCTKCGKTVCIDEYAVPRPSLPGVAAVESAQLVVRGVCAGCSC